MARIEYFIIGAVTVLFEVSDDKKGTSHQSFTCKIGQFHKDKDLIVAICDDSKYFKKEIFPFYCVHFKMSDTENNMFDYNGEVLPTNDMQKEVIGVIKNGIVVKNLLR